MAPKSGPMPKTNPALTRLFMCEISISRNTLTENGKFSQAQSWQDMENTIKEYLSDFLARLRFIEWANINDTEFTLITNCPRCDADIEVSWTTEDTEVCCSRCGQTWEIPEEWL